MQHQLHLTDGNDARYFIAVHTQSNDGVQQTPINVAKDGNTIIGVGGFWWQYQYHNKLLFVATPVSRFTDFGGNAIIGVSSKWWQCNGKS